VRFDRTRESEFLSFAVPTSIGEIRRYFRDSGWAVRVPRRLKEIHAHAISVTNELSHHRGAHPQPTNSRPNSVSTGRRWWKR
jgi:RNA polymerase sigma-B factor